MLIKTSTIKTAKDLMVNVGRLEGRNMAMTAALKAGVIAGVGAAGTKLIINRVNDKKSSSAALEAAEDALFDEEA